MDRATWTELLIQLIDVTRNRRSNWRLTDSPGTVVLAQESGSVVLRGLPIELAPGSNLRNVLHEFSTQSADVELRDENGALVAALTGPASSLLRGGITFDDPDITSTVMDESLGMLVRQLVETIGASRYASEHVARRLIDELRGDS